MLKYYVDENGLSYFTGKMTDYVDTQIESLSSVIDGKLSRSIANSAIYNNTAVGITGSLTQPEYESASGLAREGVNYYIRTQLADGSYSYMLVTSGITVGETDVSSYYVTRNPLIGLQVPTDLAVINFLNEEARSLVADITELQEAVSELETASGNFLSKDIETSQGTSTGAATTITDITINVSSTAASTHTEIPTINAITSAYNPIIETKLSTAVAGGEGSTVVTTISASLTDTHTTVPTSKAVLAEINPIKTRLNTAELGISTNAGNITTNANNISSMDGRLTAAETNITNKISKDSIDTSIPDVPADTKVPSTKLMVDSLAEKLGTAVTGATQGTKASSIVSFINSEVTDAMVPTALAVKTKTDALESSISTNTSNISSLTTTVQGHTSDIENLEEGLEGKLDVTAKSTTLVDSDDYVPSSKAVRDAVNAKMDASVLVTSLTNSDSQVPSTSAVTTALADKLNNAVVGAEQGIKATTIVPSLGNDHTSVPTSLAVKNAIDGVSGDVSGLSTRVGTLETTVSGLGTDLNTLEGTVSGLSDDISDINDALDTKVDKSSVKTSITDSDDDIPTSKAINTALSNKLSNAVSGATGDVKATNIVSSLGTGSNTTVPTTKAVTDVTDSLDTRLDTAEGSIGTLTTTVNGHTTSINTLESVKVDKTSIVTSFDSTSDTTVPSSALTQTALSGKVNTSAVKTTLNNSDSEIPTSGAVTSALSDKLSTAVTGQSGSVKATSIVSSLVNNHTTVPTSGAVVSVTNGLDTRISANATGISGLDTRVTELEADVSSQTTDLSGKVDKTSIDTSALSDDNTKIPSSKLVDSLLDNKLDNAVSGATEGAKATSIVSSIGTPTTHTSVPTTLAVYNADQALSTRITTNATNISTNASNISTNASNISANASAIEGLEGDISDINTALDGKVSKTDINTSIPATALNTQVPSTLLLKTELGNKLSTAVTGAGGSATATGIVSTLNSSSNTTVPTTKAVTDVTGELSTSIGTNATNISALDGRLDTVEGTLTTQATTISNKLDKSAVKTSISSSSTDEQVPSAKCVYTELGNKLSTAVSGAGDSAKATSIVASLGNDHTTVPTSKAVKDALDEKLSIATNTSGVSVTGGIVTTLGTTHTTVPTSKAVKDVTDSLSTSIGTNASNISTNASNIATNTSNISTNTSAIADLDGRLDTVEAALPGKLNNAVTGAGDSITVGNIVASLGNNHTTVPTSLAVKDVTDGLSTRIGTNTTNIATNTSNISDLTTRVTTAETDIGNKFNTANIDTSAEGLSSNSDTNVPSSKLINNLLGEKLSTAVSGQSGSVKATSIVSSIGTPTDHKTVPTTKAVYDVTSGLASDISTNATNIATNASDISDLESDVSDINTALGGKFNASNIDASIPDTAVDTHVPSTKLLKTELGNKLSTAVTGATAGAKATSIVASLENATHGSVPTTLAVSDAIGTVTALIPTQASASNQLADKNFVNSSIATQTSTFRGTWNLVNETTPDPYGLGLAAGASNDQIIAKLEEKVTTATVNDYVFVKYTDTAGNTEFMRFKCVNGSNNTLTWAYEYTLNNSSFTANQWAAINGTASKLGSDDIGASNKPIYLDNGVAKECGFTVATNVPAEAVFTDTWKANTKAEAGYVTAGGSNVNKFWRTDASGNPGWGSETTYSAFTGATASKVGVSGLVPAPAAGDTTKFLCSNGSWANPVDGYATETYVNTQIAAAIGAAIAASY